MAARVLALMVDFQPHRDCGCGTDAQPSRRKSADAAQVRVRDATEELPGRPPAPPRHLRSTPDRAHHVAVVLNRDSLEATEQAGRHFGNQRAVLLLRRRALHQDTGAIHHIRVAGPAQFEPGAVISSSLPSTHNAHPR